MSRIRNWMLGAAVVAGVAALGAAPANAAEFRFGVRGPVAYVPACPGPGYVWVGGYWASGAWVPGYWHFGGVRPVGPVVGFGYGRGYDRHFVYERGRYFRR
jgi:hypothetical protein